MAAAQTKQLCIVSLGYQRLLLPQAQALKLLEIASKALTLEADFDTGRMLYRAGMPLEVEVTTVRAEQLIMPAADMVPAKPRARSQAPRLTRQGG